MLLWSHGYAIAHFLSSSKFSKYLRHLISIYRVKTIMRRLRCASKMSSSISFSHWRPSLIPSWQMNNTSFNTSPQKFDAAFITILSIIRDIAPCARWRGIKVITGCKFQCDAAETLCTVSKISYLYRLHCHDESASMIGYDAIARI